MEFISNYWDDEELRLKFIEFTRQIHGLDLTLWGEHGFWDDQFVPFSFLEGGELISNVCIYLLPMRVDRKDVIVSQISTVATAPAYRRRGLNRELTTRALSWCKDRTADFRFFFADRPAFPFYAKCGFTPVSQHRFSIPVPKGSIMRNCVKLDPSDPHDLDTIIRLIEGRAPVSDSLGSLSKKLFMFHVLYTVRDCAFLIRELDVILFARPVGDRVRILDIVGPYIPHWADVVEFLPAGEYQFAEFDFIPDKLGLSHVQSVEDDEENGTHVQGPDFPFYGQPFRFPHTAHA